MDDILADLSRAVRRNRDLSRTAEPMSLEERAFYEIKRLREQVNALSMEALRRNAAPVR